MYIRHLACHSWQLQIQLQLHINHQHEAIVRGSAALRGLSHASKGCLCSFHGTPLTDILIKAARRDFGILLKQLIDHGVDVSAVDKDGQTVLHHVSIDGSVKMAKLLVDNGADVNAQGGYYGNALYAASDKGYQEIVQILVDNKADVNAQGGRYGSALYAASDRGCATTSRIEFTVEYMVLCT